MLPVMFAARKLDGEDPQTIYWLRIVYGVVQTLCILVVVIAYVKASAVATVNTVIYVPPAPQVSTPERIERNRIIRLRLCFLLYHVYSSLTARLFFLPFTLQYFVSVSLLLIQIPRRNTRKFRTVHTSCRPLVLSLDPLCLASP